MFKRSVRFILTHLFYWLMLNSDTLSLNINKKKAHCVAFLQSVRLYNVVAKLHKYKFS